MKPTKISSQNGNLCNKKKKNNGYEFSYQKSPLGEKTYEEWSKIITSIAKKFHKRVSLHSHLEDLVQEGWMVLIRCQKTFNPQGSSFITYAYTCIKNEFIKITNSVQKYDQKISSSGLLLDPKSDEGVFFDKTIYSDVVNAIHNKLSDDEFSLIKDISESNMAEVARLRNIPQHIIQRQVSKIRNKFENNTSYRM